jgi:putative ABC transport system ATP-binding protein
MPELEIRELTIEYTAAGYSIRPLDRLDLQARAGSLTILLGPSGCGKTSLLSALGGILTPQHGRIRFGDVDVTALEGRELIEYRRRTVGIVFQAFNLVPSLSAVENVMMPMRAARMSRRAALARALVLLEQVDLAGRAHQRPGQLSGGQQQRVAVARALALDPPLLLADEPTAHLDYLQVEEVLALLRRLGSGERVVVVATHDQRLLPLADQVVELAAHAGTTSRPEELVPLAPGQVLFRQGSWGDLIYVIAEGEVEIVTELEGGEEELRTVLGPGEYFGEIGPLFSMPRAATARARATSVVVGYTTRDFRERIRPLGSAPGAGSGRRGAVTVGDEGDGRVSTFG